jgi:hypothetical protein
MQTQDGAGPGEGCVELACCVATGASYKQIAGAPGNRVAPNLLQLVRTAPAHEPGSSCSSKLVCWLSHCRVLPLLLCCFVAYQASLRLSAHHLGAVP